mgnify:CR=1 FL=1
MPASAVDGTNVDALERSVPASTCRRASPLYPPDYLTDQTERFYVVRDRARAGAAKHPRRAAVLDGRGRRSLRESDASIASGSYCTILVERESQKPIVVGKGGDMIKQIGRQPSTGARGSSRERVFLDLHVKVKSEWRNDDRVPDEINIQNRGQVYGLTTDWLPVTMGTVSTNARHA